MAWLRCFTAVFIVLALVGSKSTRAEIIGPDPGLTPGEVVAIQLNALKDNDEPVRDAGIAQTFALAHPRNKRVTGPLPRFALMIRSPAYRHLLGHVSHEIRLVAEREAAVLFNVVIQTPGGSALEYKWEVAKVAEGEFTGAWLTTSVSAPAGAGQAI